MSKHSRGMQPRTPALQTLRSPMQSLFLRVWLGAAGGTHAGKGQPRSLPHRTTTFTCCVPASVQHSVFTHNFRAMPQSPREFSARHGSFFPHPPPPSSLSGPSWFSPARQVSSCPSLRSLQKSDGFLLTRPPSSLLPGPAAPSFPAHRAPPPRWVPRPTGPLLPGPAGPPGPSSPLGSPTHRALPPRCDPAAEPPAVFTLLPAFVGSQIAEQLCTVRAKRPAAPDPRFPPTASTADFTSVPFDVGVKIFH